MDVVRDGSVLKVQGQLDGRCLTELRDALRRYVDEHPTEAVVDVSGVESVDLLVLRMFAATSRVEARQGRRIVLRGCTPGVRRLLHLSHLRAHLVVEPGTASV